MIQNMTVISFHQNELHACGSTHLGFSVGQKNRNRCLLVNRQTTEAFIALHACIVFIWWTEAQRPPAIPPPEHHSASWLK